MRDTTDLELAIVGSIMLDDTDAIMVVTRLEEGYFRSHLAQMIFKAIAKLVSRDMPIDAILVSSIIIRDDQGVDEGDIYEVASKAPNPKNISAYVFELICHREEDGTIEKPPKLNGEQP